LRDQQVQGADGTSSGVGDTRAIRGAVGTGPVHEKTHHAPAKKKTASAGGLFLQAVDPDQ